MLGLPFGRFPRGWFQIGWSEEFFAGVAKPLQYFGRELVAFRDSTSALCVLDAHCPHLGAHLGYGGKIRGDTIECPFHGWVWDAQGNNVAIPGTERINRAQRIRCWDVRENSGAVLLWFDPDGHGPTWEVDTLIDDPTLYYPILPHASKMWELRIQPQLVADNAVDSLHFAYVHRAAAPATIASYEEFGPRLHVSQQLVYGGTRSATWLTPTGEVEGSIEVDQWGVGLALARFAGVDEAYLLVSTTPIDEERSELRVTNWAPREPGCDVLSDGARRRILEEFKQTERDATIWEHLEFVEQPPYSPTEARHYRRMRAWSKRFYEPVGERSATKAAAWSQ